ncbi:unnamed protein product, partial [Staurois parvus]
ISGLPAPCLCALPGSAQHHDPVPGPDHVITDWPISDHL